MDLPIEFLSEEELLAEFHRAGIWLDDEPRPRALSRLEFELCAWSQQNAAMYQRQLAQQPFTTLQQQQQQSGLQNVGIGSLFGALGLGGLLK